MSKQRGIIEGRAREVILNVNEYFEDEKTNCKMLLFTLADLLLEAEKDKCNEVLVQKELLEDIVAHLKRTTRVHDRVVAATCINKNTLTKLKREGNIAKINNTKLETPVRRPRGKKDFFGETDLDTLKNFIFKNFISRKEKFKFRNLLGLVRQDFNYKGSISTLRRTMCDLGFKLQKSPGSVTLIFTGNIHTMQSQVLPEEDRSEEMICVYTPETKTVSSIYNTEECLEKRSIDAAIQGACLNAREKFETMYNNDFFEENGNKTHERIQAEYLDFDQ